MSHSVVLKWNAPTSGAAVVSYDVQRSSLINGVVTPFASIASPEPTTTTFTDQGPFVEGGSYEYQVCSVNSAGESQPCPEVAVTIPFSIPNSPTNLVATLT